MRDIMKKGIKYKYIIPDDSDVKEDLFELVRLLNLKDTISHFECKYVDPYLIESDVTIIDPNTAHEHGLIFAPCESPYYQFKVFGSHLFRLKNRFRKLWKIASLIEL